MDWWCKRSDGVAVLLLFYADGECSKHGRDYEDGAGGQVMIWCPCWLEYGWLYQVVDRH